MIFMISNFYAYLSRMKLIKRWSLMRNIQKENISEHSHQVAIIAHALAVISNTYYKGGVDPGRIVLLAIYHDAGEVIIGDLPTPVKYFNPEIKTSYREIESIAKDKLLSYLPKELADQYQPLFFADEDSYEYRLVKAADKISAYIKCLEESTAGNKEFALAQKSILESIEAYRDISAVTWFMDNCLDAFSKTLDEMG
jgi:5'-deoxynucleotidase